MAKEYQSFTTEQGAAKYSKVNTQVDQFEQADGSIKDTGYVINVYFDDTTTEKYKKQALDKIKEAQASGEYVDKKGKPSVWREKPRVPFKEDEDGKTYFIFKTNHQKKQDDNTYVPRYVPLFDEYGKPMGQMTAIGNDSIVKINFSPSIFYISSEQNGVKFFLNAIQVLDLKEFSGGSSAEAFGFTSAPNEFFPDEDEPEI